MIKARFISYISHDIDENVKTPAVVLAVRFELFESAKVETKNTREPVNAPVATNEQLRRNWRGEDNVIPKFLRNSIPSCVAFSRCKITLISPFSSMSNTTEFSF